MRVSPVSLEEIKLTCLFIWIFHTLLTILWSLIKSCIYQGCHTGYGWYGFHRTRFFWSRWVFYYFIQNMKLSSVFYMKFQIQLWSLLFTFILPCFYLMQRSKDNHVPLPYFTRTFFLRLMQCDDLMHKLTMQVECFIYIRRLQTCVIIRRSSTIKTKYSNHWAM